MIEIIYLALINLFGIILVDTHCASTPAFERLEELCVSLEGGLQINHAPSMGRCVTDPTQI